MEAAPRSRTARDRGMNTGTLLGRSHGGMLTLAYSGLIKKK